MFCGVRKINELFQEEQKGSEVFTCVQRLGKVNISSCLCIENLQTWQEKFMEMVEIDTQLHLVKEYRGKKEVEYT